MKGYFFKGIRLNMSLKAYWTVKKSKLDFDKTLSFIIFTHTYA
jgi:hypothetical protein